MKIPVNIPLTTLLSMLLAVSPLSCLSTGCTENMTTAEKVELGEAIVANAADAGVYALVVIDLEKADFYQHLSVGADFGSALVILQANPGLLQPRTGVVTDE
jgi:hypothetical protein